MMAIKDIRNDFLNNYNEFFDYEKEQWDTKRIEDVFVEKMEDIKLRSNGMNESEMCREAYMDPVPKQNRRHSCWRNLGLSNIEEIIDKLVWEDKLEKRGLIASARAEMA